MLGRLSLNPVVHIDLIGTLLFPLVAITTGLPLIGWAKPVPVDFRNLRSPRRDFAVVAAAGPASNVMLAVIGAVVFASVGVASPSELAARAGVQLRDPQRAAGRLQHAADPAARRRQRPDGRAAGVVGAAWSNDSARSGSSCSTRLMLTGVLSALMRAGARFILGWLL